MSPQFHVKFDDFFETVSDKSTDFDAPEPGWKYLSGFAVRKERTKTNSTGLESLITPRRGPVKTLPSTGPRDQPVHHPQDLTDPVPQDERMLPQEAAIPDNQPPLTLPQQQNDQAAPSTRQTRSRRVICNTPRYEQSVNQRNQGLVAWEVLLDQDDRENVPTAASQYDIQKAQDNPLAFAALGNPDILYWDQAMKSHDCDKFIEAVSTELEGHEKMGNYTPIPLEQIPKGTMLIDMVWSM